MDNRRVSHGEPTRDITGMGKTNIYFSGPNAMMMASNVSGITDVRPVKSIHDIEKDKRR